MEVPLRAAGPIHDDHQVIMHTNSQAKLVSRLASLFIADQSLTPCLTLLLPLQQLSTRPPSPGGVHDCPRHQASPPHDGLPSTTGLPLPIKFGSATAAVSGMSGLLTFVRGARGEPEPRHAVLFPSDEPCISHPAFSLRCVFEELRSFLACSLRFSRALRHMPCTTGPSTRQMLPGRVRQQRA